MVSVPLARFSRLRGWDLRNSLLVALLVASQLGGFKAGPIDALDVLTLVIFGLWIARRLTDRGRHIETPALLFFAGGLLVLSIPNLVHLSLFSFAIGTLILLKSILLAFLFVQLIDTRPRAVFTVRVLVAVAVASAVAGIIQILVFRFTGVPYTLLVEWSPGESFKHTPIGLVLRASALSPSAQILSTLLILALPFLLFRVTQARRQFGQRLLAGISVGLLLIGLLLTWNYVSLAAAAVVLVAFPFLRWPQATLQLLLALLVFLSIAYYTGLLEWIYSVSLGDPSIAKGMTQRMTLLKLGLEKIGEDAMFGVGKAFSRYPGNYWHRPVHNAYVQAAVELGVLGGLLFLGMLATLLTQLVFVARERSEYSLTVLRPAILAFTAILIAMLGEPLMDSANTWIMLGLVQAVLRAPPASRPTMNPLRAAARA